MDKRDTDDGDEKAARLADDFHDVDSSGAPGDFIAYLRKAEESESGRLVREATYRPLGAIAGRGADIGCGTGRAVADLTRLGKDVVGVDSSQAMVDAALTRFPHCEVVKGDACDLLSATASCRGTGRNGPSSTSPTPLRPSPRRPGSWNRAGRSSSPMPTSTPWC